MNEERKLAKEHGVESPIWDTIAETHACYNECMELAINNVQAHSLVFVASHNKDTCDIAKKIIRERNFNDHRVRFGQLKAFSD